MKKWKSIRLMCLIGAVLLQMENMDALAAEPGGSDPGWICLDGKWYWQKADMTAATGWLSAGGIQSRVIEVFVKTNGPRFLKQVREVIWRNIECLCDRFAGKRGGIAFVDIITNSFK